MAGSRGNFLKLRFSDGLKNTIFIFDFTNTVFHKRAMLLIFCTEYTESVLDILFYPESTMAHHGWAWRKFSKCVLSRLENANTVNTSFYYMFFQLLYKHHVAFNSSKII